LKDTFSAAQGIDISALENQVLAMSSDIQQVKSHLEQSLQQVTSSITTLEEKVDKQHNDIKTSFHQQNSVIISIHIELRECMGAICEQLHLSLPYPQPPTSQPASTSISEQLGGSTS
jgi:vacuolar-type H+-ATPase subunit D/Vma8